MADGFEEVSFTADISKAISILRGLEAQLKATAVTGSRALKQIDDQAKTTASDLSNVGKGLSDGSKGIRGDVQALINDLKSVSEAAKGAAASGSGGGTRFPLVSSRKEDLPDGFKRPDLGGHVTDLDKKIQFDEAASRQRNLSILDSMRQRYAEEDRLGKEASAKNAFHAEKEALASRQKNLAMLDSMRQRYAEEDRIAAGVATKNAFLTEKEALASRQKNLAIVNSMRQRYAEEDSAAKKAADAQNQLTAAHEEFYGHLPRYRYALMDLSNTFAILGAATIAASIAPITLAANFQRGFADVQRVTQGTATQFQYLKTQLEAVYTTTPTSFKDLTEIATLAGQLGVASTEIANFSKNTAMFATTSDMSAEATATAFGRISKVVDGVDGQYEKLASSVLAVGTASVATESSIANIMTQLSASANSVKLSAAELAGFSAALASIGIQPELARGTVTRVFGEISAAVAAGGAELESYAQIAGMTGEKFRESWGQEGKTMPTLMALLEGLGRMSGEAGAAERALQSLGVNAVRDIQVMSKLAQNTDMVAESLSVAERGWADGSELATQYGIVASTVSEKFKILSNNFQLFIANIGAASSGGVSVFIDMLTRLVQILDNIASNPLAQAFSAVLVPIGLFVGALALVAAGVTRAMAGMAAMRTVLYELNALAPATSSRLGVLSLAFRTTDLAARGASAGVMSLSTALKSTAIGLGITFGIMAIGAALDGLTSKFQTAKEKAAEAFGGQTGFEDAVAADTKAYLAALEAREKGLEYNKSAIDSAVVYKGVLDENIKKELEGVEAQRQYAESQRGVASAADSTTGAIANQSVALGENTKEWLRTQLEASKGFQELAQDKSAQKVLEQVGFSWSEYLKKSLEGQGEAYLQTFSSKVAALQEVVNNGLTNDATAYKGGVFIDEDLAGLKTGVDGVSEALSILNQIQEEHAQQTNIEIEGAKVLTEVEGYAKEALGETAAAQAAKAEALAETISQTYESINADLALLDAEMALADGLYNLGSAIGQGADNFDILSANGRKATGSLKSVVQNILKIDGANPAQAAANLQALYNIIMTRSPGAAANLGWLSNQIAKLVAAAGGKVAVAPTINMSGVNDGYGAGLAEMEKKAGKSGSDAGKNFAGGMQKEVRTLVDYANDLEKVFKRAFDIRFSGESSYDKILGIWDSLRADQAKTGEAARKAREEVEKLTQELADLRAEQAKLSADRSVQEYFLRIAEAYGDTLRADQLRADILETDRKLAKNNNALSKTNTGLEKAFLDASDATDDMQKSLIGDSKAAIENRAKILELVKAYQDHISALASSGMGSEELARRTAQLKQQFIDQAVQLGYSRDQVLRYASAFDDVSLAIARVPRNVTVTADVNPAIQALNEMNAKLAASTGKTYSNTVVTNEVKNTTAGPTDHSQRIAQLEAAIKRTQDMIASGEIPSGMRQEGYDSIAWMRAQIKALRGYSDGGFVTGGWSGFGTKYKPAGLLHGGEFVLRKDQVNQYNGLPKTDVLANMILAQARVSSTPKASSSPGNLPPGSRIVVTLDEYSIAMLTAGQKVEISPTALSNAVSGSNTANNYLGSY